MVCIYCHADTNVSNSRHQKRRNTVWRRRSCQACGAIFTTIEAPEDSQALSVIQHSGEIQGFLREKLLISLHKSLQHRTTSLYDSIGLTDTIAAQIYQHARHGSIAAEHITALTITALEHFDRSAAVHYRAFHATPAQ